MIYEFGIIAVVEFKVPELEGFKGTRPAPKVDLRRSATATESPLRIIISFQIIKDIGIDEERVLVASQY